MIKLPPPPSVDVTYPATTDYFWGTIEQNATAQPAAGTFSTGSGPFGFKTSLVLPGDSCMVQKGFARRGDDCIGNPDSCEDGMSFSLWEKTVYTEDVFAPREEQQLRYLLSTGGDDQGSPGVAIYLQGMTLGAVVSTGAEYWLIETVGHLSNNTWNNIGVRWRKPPQDSDGSSSSGEFGGLQVFINQKPAGYVVHGVTPQAIAKQPLSPPEFMVGCHKASGEDEYRHFCPCEFDEIAMWQRSLLLNETMFFLGGFEANFSDVTPDELANILSNVDLTDPDQQSVAVTLINNLATAPEEEVDIADSPLTGQTQDEEEEEEESSPARPANRPQSAGAAPPASKATKKQVNNMKTLSGMLFTMTQPEVIKANQTAEELGSFLNLAYLASTLLEDKNSAKWNAIEEKNVKNDRPLKKGERKKPRVKEAVDMLNSLETWALDSAAAVVFEPDQPSDIMVHKSTPNVDLYVEQNDVSRLRQSQTARYPSDNVRKLDTIELPTIVLRRPGCEEAKISTVFAKYDSFGAMSPKRFIQKHFVTDQPQYLDVDSPVLSLRLRVMKDEIEADECLPTIDELRAAPVRVALTHKQPKQTLRQPLFHENEIQSDVLRRHCVWWNQANRLGLGAWDPTGCVVLESNDFYTRCACKAIGQYAVIAEKVEPKIVDIDTEWLNHIKSAFHTTSMILLIVYAITVARSDQLWELFHQMRMTTALLLLAGAFFMCMSDLDSTRQDRHHCTVVAAFLQLFYLAAGTMVACEGYACFRALTSGIIGGNLRAYWAISGGVSLLSLGYALAIGDIHRYGDDPQCMMGWETDVKLIFFGPMMLTLLVTLISVVLVALNMSTPQLRKESIMVDQLTICSGYNYFSLFFIMTWMAGLLAYVRLETADGLPSFYPLFQFLNAASGLVFFICQGLLSRRFRMVVSCRGRERRRELLAYAENEGDLSSASETELSGDDDDDSESESESEDDAAETGLLSRESSATEAERSQSRPGSKKAAGPDTGSPSSATEAERSQSRPGSRKAAGPDTGSPQRKGSGRVHGEAAAADTSAENADSPA